MKRFLPSLPLVVAFLVILQGSLRAQGFSQNFTVAEGWTTGGAALTSGNNTKFGWTTNDPLTGTVGQQVGETNFVRYITGFTPGGSRTNSSIIFGGVYQANGYFAGVRSPEISRAFSPFGSLSGAQFVRTEVDFGVIGSSGNYTNQDRFTFDLRSASGASLLSLSFSPTPLAAGAPAILPGYNLRIDWISGSTVQTTANPALVGYYDVGYSQRYRLQVDMTQNSFIARVLTLNATQTVVASSTVVQNGAFANGFSASDYAQLAVVWNIVDTLQNNAAIPAAYNNAGSNYVALNAVSVVPEPATLALLMIGAFALALTRCNRWLRGMHSPVRFPRIESRSALLPQPSALAISGVTRYKRASYNHLSDRGCVAKDRGIPE